MRIGAITPEQLEHDLAPYISHENAVWLHARSSSFMKVVELLQSLKLTDTNGCVELTLSKPDEKAFTLWIAPTKSDSTMITAQEALHIPPPLYAKRHEFYWYEYLRESQSLYIQYRVCADDPKHHFTKFVKDVFACADSHHVIRTIVDLRFNGGGNSEVANPLLEEIKSRPALNAKGHLFVLIGPMTFSSGEWAAEELHNSFRSLTSELVDGFYWFRPKWANEPRLGFNSTFVGEPTGGKPNCYGEVHNFEMPNSKLVVGYAVKQFQLTTDGDPLSREPDIVIRRSWADYLAGRDPVLDTVLHWAAK
jgi:hypothetical protein